MCGIAGILRTDPLPPEGWDVLAEISSALSHRGPDDHGFFVSGPVGLAHRRLSIIDVVGGRQPMIAPEGGQALVYNGELYNFQALRAELEAKGTRFVTRSDTEVLLKLVDAERLEWLRRLNGMFAFAAWDQSSRRLILARDRLGIKPLYYATFPDEFVFASEIKGLLRHPRVKREVNTARIPEYLAFRCLAGVETMFKGIYEVPPGHAFVISQPDLSIKKIQFWPHTTVSEPRDASADSLDEMKTVLADSVRRQLVSDVPVGIYLSGGVDSSLITVLTQPFRAAGQFHTFSVGFEEDGFDESEYARGVAEQTGSTHHAVTVTEAEYVDRLEDTVRQFDEPMNHAHSVQLQLLSQFAKSYVTVILTGEGADELFGGYPRMQIPLLARRLRALPQVVSRPVSQAAGALGLRRIVKLLDASANEREAMVHSARFVPRRDFERLRLNGIALTGRHVIYDELAMSGGTLVDRILKFDQRTYLPSILMRLDRTSMAASVECRVPFLDNEVIDHSARVPDEMKIRLGRENKVALKKIAAGLLPRETVYRRKSGFGTPLAKWLRNPRGLGRYLDVIADRTAVGRGFVDCATVGRMVEEHRTSAGDHSELLWSLLGLELWCRTIVDQSDAGLRRSHSRPDWSSELARLELVNFGGQPVVASHSGMAI